MATLSRTAEQCRKCPNAKNCDNKRMEACALAELSNQTRTNSIAPCMKNASMSVSNPITPIIIKQGEYGDIHTTMEEINKNIAKSLGINACYFNK